MPEAFLDSSPVWLLYAGTVLVLLAGNEAGFRLGLWRRGRMPEGEKAPATAIMGSTLGLLAFMLAFTFGMAGARFDARKQLVWTRRAPSSGPISAHSSCRSPRGASAADCFKSTWSCDSAWRRPGASPSWGRW